MSTNDYARGFTDALEVVLGIFNRLKDKNCLASHCVRCKLIQEIGQLMLLAKEQQFEKIMRQVGYYLR